MTDNKIPGETLKPYAVYAFPQTNEELGRFDTLKEAVAFIQERKRADQRNVVRYQRHIVWPESLVGKDTTCP
jgi:hypothetical protein